MPVPADMMAMGVSTRTCSGAGRGWPSFSPTGSLRRTHDLGQSTRHTTTHIVSVEVLPSYAQTRHTNEPCTALADALLLQ